jgi:Domain of unknown function (DUF4326)
MAESKVVHCKRDSYDVYIGRPSKWGNPFVIGRDGTRSEVIEMYRTWLYLEPRTKLREEARRELRGKRLGCFCAPLACHGDILLELANG